MSFFFGVLRHLLWGQEQRRYCARLYYRRTGIHSWDIHFVIMLNSEPLIAAVNAVYAADDRLHLSVEFEEDRIALDIPDDGYTLRGWNITPLTPLVIRKYQVDAFVPGHRVPCCQLYVEWIGQQEKPVELAHRVNMLGAKEPFNFFLIRLPPLPGSSAPRFPPSELHVPQHQLGIEDLADITVYLHPLDRIAVFNLGLVLGLDYSRLSALTDSPAFLAEMLAEWLQRVDQVQKVGVPTWRRLVEALRDPRIGQNGIASAIEQDKETAGSDKVEVKDQQIQTETIETEDQHVQVGSMALQQADSGKVKMKDQQIETETVDTKDQYVQAGSMALQQGYLRGVEVIDHTSFTYTGQAKSFDWVNHGFKLHLPEKALPPEVEECDIHVKVSLSGQFQFPDGSDVISGIYWIFTPHVFIQPVTVEIQHCIQFFSPEDSDNLRFVVAKCSQKNLPYQFKILEGGVFYPHSTYGSIQLTQFSGFGAIRRDKKHTRTRKSYCAKLYYIPKNSAGWDVDFVITLNTELHMSGVHSVYATMGARVGPHQNVMFAGKEITLDIPLQGITLDTGWTITPLVHPGIMKNEVDYFLPGKRVPSCQLYIKWNRKEKPSDELQYSVKLVGAKEPFNFFNIYPTASTPLPVDGPVTLTTQLQTGHITSDERPNLLKLLNFRGRSGRDISIPKEIGTKYCLFGVRLLNDETGAEVSTIATKYRDDAEQINLEILRLWVGGKGRPLSWGMLIDTLRETGLNTLASDIQNGLQP